MMKKSLAKKRLKTAPARKAKTKMSARGGRSTSAPPKRAWTEEDLAAKPVTKAHAEVGRLESERRAAVQKLKDEKATRETALRDRMKVQQKEAQRSASMLRASTTAAVMSQKAQMRGARKDGSEELKQHRDALRRQREEQNREFRANAKLLNDKAVASRNAATNARNELRERNLSDAHKSTAELLEKFREGSEAQNSINDTKRMLAEKVRKEAGLEVVRGAISKANAEKMASATELRKGSERAAVDAEMGRMQHLEANKASAYRMELAASPERVRQLKTVEAKRKANMGNGLRRQYRALEALALERRTEEAATRQRMHDAVMCARYGMPEPDNNPFSARSPRYLQNVHIPGRT